MADNTGHVTIIWQKYF